MKKLSAIVLLFAFLSQAQTQRFVYEYQFSPDSNKKDSVVTELMALDIKGSTSRYQSLKKIKSDSMIATVQKNLIAGLPVNFSNIVKSPVKYEILKENNAASIYLIDQIAKDIYRVEENEKMKWQIFQEKEKIGTYTAQKATTTWGGRNWTAWFSTDLPFHDGPYKFSGLPGLIVKIEDESKSHKIILIGTENIALENEAAVPELPGRRRIDVNEEQYKKIFKNLIANPSQSLNGSSGNIISTNKSDGDNKQVSSAEMGKIIKQNAEREVKNNSNRIEPTLFE